MRLGPGLLYEGRTLQGARPKLADFCSATMAEFYSAVDTRTDNTLYTASGSLLHHEIEQAGRTNMALTMQIFVVVLFHRRSVNMIVIDRPDVNSNSLLFAQI